MSIATSSIVVAGADALASQYNDLRKDVLLLGGDYLVSATGNDTYSVTPDSQITAYTTGMIIKLKPDTANTLACCLDIGIATSMGTFTVTIASPGVFTFNSHGLVEGDIVRFTTSGALPTGLSVNTNYFVINTATNTFQVSATKAGSAINTTGSQSGTHTLFSRTKHIKSRTGGDPRTGDVVVGPNILELSHAGDWILMTTPQRVQSNKANTSINTTGTTVIAHGLGKTPDKVSVHVKWVITANIYNISDGSFDSSGQTSTYFTSNNGAGTMAIGGSTTQAVSGASTTGVITVDDTNVTITWTGTSYSGVVNIECEA